MVLSPHVVVRKSIKAAGATESGRRWFVEGVGYCTLHTVGVMDATKIGKLRERLNEFVEETEEE